MNTDYQDICNVVARYFRSVDELDWSATRYLMSNPFHLDYSSYSGQQAEQMDPDDVLAAWQEVLPGFDHLHHQIGNMEVQIEGDKARVLCHGTAIHAIDEQSASIVGQYQKRLSRIGRRWIITASRFSYKLTIGEPGLAELAQKRVAERA